MEIIDAETNQTYVFKSKIVFVNASALNSAWVLMNSATDVWEGGLGSSSGELGHNVMDHHFRVGASADVEGFDDKYTYGRRPSGFMFLVLEIGEMTSAIIYAGSDIKVVPVVQGGEKILPRWVLGLGLKMPSVNEVRGRLV